MLSDDDAVNFSEVCPLFEPFFVFYDEAKESYKDLADLQRAILRWDEGLPGSKRPS